MSECTCNRKFYPNNWSADCPIDSHREMAAKLAAGATPGSGMPASGEPTREVPTTSPGGTPVLPQPIPPGGPLAKEFDARAVKLFDLVQQAHNELRPYLRIETFPTGGIAITDLAIDVILQGALEEAAGLFASGAQCTDSKAAQGDAG